MKQYFMISGYEDIGGGDSNQVDNLEELVYLASEVEAELARRDERERELMAKALEERASKFFFQAIRHAPKSRRRNRERRRQCLNAHYARLLRENKPGWWNPTNKGDK